MEEARQEITVPDRYESAQINEGLDAEESSDELLIRACGTATNGEQLSREDLSRVFSDFNRVATALDESYQVLEERVSSLKRELSETRLARHWDQAEKDRLANRLASLVSVLPCAVLVLNKSGLIIDRNPLASQALNEPLIGLSWEFILEREGVSECPPSNEINLPDGRVFSVARDGLAVSSDSAIFLTDVTDIHKAQQDMARNKRLTEMGEMAASMAHQIRTPLSAAHLYMSPLSRADQEKMERAETVAKLQDRLAHIGKLIDSMLSFVRGTRSTVKQVRLQSVLNRIRTLVSYEAENYQAELYIPSISNDIYVEADTEALVGALSNIVLNAFEIAANNTVDQHSIVYPEVLFEINMADQQKPETQKIELRIKDNGPGIDADKLDRIFDPFYTTRSTGTGLGLAIAAMTCKEHGGDIYACNQKEGGAEFVISLPFFYSQDLTSPSVDSEEIETTPPQSTTKRLNQEVA